MVLGLSLLFEALAVVFCLHYLYGEKIYFDIKTVGFIVLDIMWMLSIYYLNLDRSLSLMIYPLIILFCGVKFGYKIKEITVNVILYVIIVGVLQSAIMVAAFIIIKETQIEQVESLIINIMVFCIIYFVLKRFNIRKISKILQSRDGIVYGSLVVAITSLTVWLMGYREKSGLDTTYYVVFIASVILIVIAIIDIGKHKMKTLEIEAELKLHKIYETSFRNLIEDICARQHEFDNHINAIYNQHLLYNNYEQLIKAQGQYCEAIIQENKYNKLLSKGNPVILGFLYGKFVEAEKQGINITYKVNIGNVESSVPIYKIIELLGNLIKNAVEELLESGLTGLHVLMIEEADLIRIEVSNEVDKIDYEEISQFFRKGYSKKGVGRGYGLYNVKKICEEHDIQIQCNDKSDESESRLSFNLLIKKSL